MIILYRRPKHQQAFTLVELLLVIVLIGILTANVYPRLTNTIADQNFFLAEEAKLSLRYARRLAMSSQCSISFMVDETTKTITLQRESVCGSNVDFTEPVSDPYKKTPNYSISAIEQEDTISSAPAFFYFTPDGEVLDENGEITDVALTVTGFTITVVGATGMIS